MTSWLELRSLLNSQVFLNQIQPPKLYSNTVILEYGKVSRGMWHRELKKEKKKERKRERKEIKV